MLGRSVFSQNQVFPTRVSADGSPAYKAGGVTVDWSNVTALGADTTFPDGSFVKAGQKVLRYGQVLCKETANGSQHTLTGTATGGTFTYSVVRNDNGQTVTTPALAFNATAAQVLAALQTVLTPEQVSSASGGALGSAAVAVTFGTNIALGTVNGSALTGGTVTPTLTGNLTTGGFFGPFDPTAADGRQLLNRGDCFVLDELLLQYSTGSNALSVSNDHVGGVIDGGLIFVDRILQSGTGAHSLAAGPTLAEFTAAFGFRFVKD